MIPAEKWKWFGFPGHFIGSRECMFRMTTQVGDVLVSTVGKYQPRGTETEQEIGYRRLYETMVFKVNGVCVIQDCGCGTPTIDTAEIDMCGYNDPVAARDGHMALCRKWAELDGRVE